MTGVATNTADLDENGGLKPKLLALVGVEQSDTKSIGNGRSERGCSTFN